MNIYWIYTIVIVLLIAVSAICSCMETAFSCANTVRLKKKSEDGNKKATLALNITDNFDKSLTAILILNNVVNLGCSALATVLCVGIFGDYGAAVATGATTLLVLTFGEVIPKCFGKEKSDSVAMATSGILRVITIVLTPLVYLFFWIKTLALKIFRVKSSDPTVTEDELKIIVESIEHQGVLEQQESEMVQSALDFDEKTAIEILTPRVDVTAIDIDDGPKHIKEVIKTQRYSRIPVYKDTVDNIVGILHTWDYLEELASGRQPEIKNLITPAHFIFQTQKLSQILADFRKQRLHIAVVTDEYGGTLGILTMEDLLEEIVGEIWDEDEEIEHEYVKLGDGKYKVSGDMALEDMLELFGLRINELESESLTVGGFILDKCGTIPKRGDDLTALGLRFTVVGVSSQRIATVVIRQLSENK